MVTQIFKVNTENKSRVLLHLLFYRNVCLDHTHTLAIHGRFIGCLPLEKYIID
jgi:hypothetical protein